jgi:hypothetical protein
MKVEVHLNEDNGPQESVCSSGYGSNGTSMLALFSANEDANSSRSCSVSTEETPDHVGPTPDAIASLSEEVAPIAAAAAPSPSPPAAATVVRRSKNSADKIAALQPHRASYPAAVLPSAVDQVNLNSSFGGSVHSSSSNVSIERLTATDDEVSSISLSHPPLANLNKFLFYSYRKVSPTFQVPSKRPSPLPTGSSWVKVS